MSEITKLNLLEREALRIRTMQPVELHRQLTHADLPEELREEVLNTAVEIQYSKRWCNMLGIGESHDRMDRAKAELMALYVVQKYKTA